MSIYTKKGDDFYTRASDGSLLKKDDKLICATGLIDEMAASLAFAISMLKSEEEKYSAKPPFCVGDLVGDLKKIIKHICAMDFASGANETMDVGFLEEKIDSFEKVLPKLDGFLMPGESPGAASLNLCRVDVRRCERELISLLGERLSKSIRQYINRLSDYLFCAMRLAMYLRDEREISI